MGKTAGKKGYLHLEAKFLCGDKVCSGVASNLSPYKMIIHAKLSFPLECRDTFKVLIIFNKKRVIVPVKIVKFMKTNCFYDAIEVKIMVPPKEYLNFIGKKRFQRIPLSSNTSEKKINFLPEQHPPNDC